MGERLGTGWIENDVEERLRRSPLVRVLEIGCGEGRVLMELGRRFPALELHGVNERPWPAMRGAQSLRRTAIHYGILTRSEAARVALPDIHFCDASALPFDTDSFDLVLSQSAFHYVRRKDRALEEVVRVLRPDGLAAIHLDSTPASRADYFVGDTPRFVIYRSDGSRVTVVERVVERCDGVVAVEGESRVQRRTGHMTTLRMRKLRPGAVSLDLEWDGKSSFSLEDLATSEPDPEQYGYRSVFRIP